MLLFISFFSSRHMTELNFEAEVTSLATDCKYIYHRAVKLVGICIPRSQVVLSLTSHKQKRKLSASLLTTFLLSQGRTDINEHSHAYNTGAAEQFRQPRTNVGCVVPEKPANVISEILKSENFPHFTQIISYLVACITFARPILKCFHFPLPGMM